MTRRKQFILIAAGLVAATLIAMWLSYHSAPEPQVMDKPVSGKTWAGTELGQKVHEVNK